MNYYYARYYEYADSVVYVIHAKSMEEAEGILQRTLNKKEWKEYTERHSNIGNYRIRLIKDRITRVF